MTKKTKIVIVGLGGVGGYFGGLLAKKYFGHKEIEIIFVARGQHLKQIQKNGLKVITGSTEFIAKPNLATDDIYEIGMADFMIICTKNYDLEASIEQLKPCINSNTMVLPLLNGVDATDRIRNIIQNGSILQGCVYIVSRLKEFGVIENIGNIQTLYFGLDNEKNDRLLLLEEILKNAGIEATLSDSISKIVWEKFIFLSPTATVTSYYDASIGEVLEDKEYLVLELIREVKQIAKAKNIAIDKEIESKTLDKMKALPYETTSSMQRDFKSLKQTELQSLTNYVIETAQELKMQTPAYDELYKHLKNKNDGF